MTNIIVKQGQSIFDIAIIYTGSMDTAFEIALLNDISIAQSLETGSVLQVPEIKKKKITELFNEKNQPATGNTIVNIVPSKGGISYWAINIDFEVQ